jgi:chromosome segregation protein
MRLKRLEILGFKSFADSFIMDFETGISSVVGPNGCGKSNVADALRWVLGTQSARQIRADVMEDVIFNGSAGRKPMGMAEVKVTFDNSDRSLALDFDEVSVTRRLFRSGVSEYLINGSKCRLMDVTDLIVDRGLGSAGYWILEAEMVKTILSPRAEDRRELFDEAAGIGRYKIQRHRAGLKLETAGTDLERLSDIISEVERTHGALKKQVAAYRRYEKARNTIELIRAALASGELLLLEQRLASARRALEQAAADEALHAGALSSLEVALAEARVRQGEAQTRLDEAHAKCASIETEMASLERERAVSTERVAGMRRTAGENMARCARERERALKYGRDAEEAEAEAARWETAAREAAQTARREEEAAAGCEDAVRKAREALSEARDRERECSDSLNELRNRYLEKARAYEAERQRAQELDQKISRGRADAQALRTSIETLSMGIEKAGLECARTGNELHEASETLSAARAASSETALRAGEAVTLKKACEREASALRNALENARSGNTLGAVISVVPGMAPAVGACLDGMQTALPVPEVHPGLPGGGARYAVGGRSCPGGLPPGAVTMDGFLASPDPVAGSVLSHYVLAPDITTALEWFGSGTAFGIVTREGNLFMPDGTVRLGVPESGTGAVELSSALDACETRLAGLTAQVSGLDRAACELRESVTRLERTTEDLRASLSDLQRNEAVLLGRKSEAERALAGLEDSLRALCKEMDGLSRANEPCPDPDTGIREGEEKLALLAEVTRAASEALEQVRERSTGVFLARERAVMNLREAENRVTQLRARALELRTEADAASTAAEELSSEAGELTSRAGVLEKELETLSKRVAGLTKERDAAGENRNRVASARAELLQKTAAIEEQSSAARSLHAQAREKRSQAHSESAGLEEKAEGLRKGLPSEDGENPFIDQPPQALADEEQRQLRIIEGIGPVNMLAVDEFNETEERLGFLTGQRLDLMEARASLETAITEINMEAQTRFQETFSQVRDHFREVFVELFGGGEADIIALDAEDPLEGGIQIMARPRGKKLENVTSLSGGERALAAVALLFSLYLVKPSPFCILDELDAPLDDANIDSFMGILRRFSTDTQFIMMTHNKRSMEASDRLYGITMAEPGVSGLTTVSLSDIE